MLWHASAQADNHNNQTKAHQKQRVWTAWPTATWWKLTVLRPLFETTSKAGLTAGQCSSRYRVLWGLQENRDECQTCSQGLFHPHATQQNLRFYFFFSKNTLNANKHELPISMENKILVPLHSENLLLKLKQTASGMLSERGSRAVALKGTFLKNTE